MVGGGPPAGMEDPEEGIPAWELKRYRERAEWWSGENAYGNIQGTKPLTLAYGLNDSPAGLAAWIVEKFRAWSDCGGDVESRFTKDQLLTNIMLYWLTESMPSAVRLYYESRRSGRKQVRSEVPTAIAVFPGEIFFSPRKWVETRYNVRAVDRDAARWALCRDGGARTVPWGRSQVFQRTALGLHRPPTNSWNSCRQAGLSSARRPLSRQAYSTGATKIEARSRKAAG